MEYRLGLYEKAMPNPLSLAEKLKATKAAGFDYMEISIDESEEKQARLLWSRDERDQLRKEMLAAGCSIDTLCLSGHRKWPLGSKNEALRHYGQRMFRLAVDLASDLGIRLIQLAGYDVYYDTGDDETNRLFLQGLQEGMSYAAMKGVCCGFETMETPFMDTVEKAMAVVRQINSSYLGIYPDLGNLTNAAKKYGTDVLADIAKGKGHLFSMHLKETRPGVYRDMKFGTGEVDFVAGIQTALSQGVRCFVSECWYDGQACWMDEIAEVNRFMHQKFEAAVVA